MAERTTQVALLLFVFVCLNLIAVPLGGAEELQGYWTDYDGSNHYCPPDCGGGSSGGSPPSNSGGGFDVPDYMTTLHNPTPEQLGIKSGAQLANEKNHECVQMHSNRDFDNAIACYEEAVRLDPSNAVIATNLKTAKCDRGAILGEQYYKEQKWALSVQYYNEAYQVCQDTTLLDWYFGKAKEALKAEQEKQAEEEKQTKLDDAKGKIDKMLDGFAMDFDGSTKNVSRGSAGSLGFMDANQPLYSKGDKNSAPVIAGQSPARPQVVTPLSPFAHAELKAHRSQLEQEYWDLENQISRETDPLSRAELINKQTYLKSEIGVLQIKILDRFKDDSASKYKDKEIRALLATGAISMAQNDFNSALDKLRKAGEKLPKDQGIQKAINYVGYLKDMSEGKAALNPKWPALVDALAYGDGDWNRCVSYLKEVRNADPNDKAMDDALKVIEGMSSYTEESAKRENKDGIDKYTRQLMSLSASDDFNEVLRVAKEANQRYPSEIGFRDVMNVAQGVVSERSRPEQGESKRDGPMVYGKKTLENVERGEKYTADQYVQMAIEFGLNQHDWESQLRILKVAHKAYPDDPGIRDGMNFAEGICAERAQRKKNGEQG